MKHLTNLEISEQSFVMIDFEDGLTEPYFVAFKKDGTISGATMLLGRKLSDLINNPKLYPCSLGETDRFYIENEKVKGKNRGVVGYRKMKQNEKEEWLTKIKKIERLSSLFQILSDN
jgi:hypothetical protein